MKAGFSRRSIVGRAFMPGRGSGALRATIFLLLSSSTLAQQPLQPVESPSPPASEQEITFSTLASYTFDDGSPLDTGPDTFRVFEQARGRVTRSTYFRFSGEHSLELRDVARNGDFPELMGFFDRRDHGQLYAHFAFLVVDPEQEFNIAFVGPRWFRMEKDGFAFWLQSKAGVLRHVSNSIPKKLFELRAFTWYLVDVLYDVDRGTYRLLIEEEGAVEPLVELADQPNATAQPGSAVDKFSFVSDPFEDLSEVVYYVDDIVLGADERIPVRRFVAPGRRKLFVTMQVEGMAAERRKLVQETKPEAEPPAANPWLDAMTAKRFGDAYREARGKVIETRAAGWDERTTAEIAAYWLEREGDAALLDGDPALALELYDQAAAETGGLPIRTQLLKRADAYHLLGDRAAEKRLREAIYGTLDAVE